MQRVIDLAKFLLDQRANGSEYDQSHLPVTQQYEAVGHAVRAVYTYSGTRFVPHAWTPALAELRDALLAHAGGRCNSVLANLYRDGRDSMGWHSDAEPELGVEPVILSLSFGGVRRFRLRHRRDPRLRLELDLPAGSLLRMAGSTQQFYRHDLPKTARPVAARINLTFRTIHDMRGDRAARA